MFTFNQDAIADYNLNNAKEFIAFWNSFYKDKITVFKFKLLIDYFAELNVGNVLTTENIRRLLRWKDQRSLTQEIISGKKQGSENPRIRQVVDILDDINKFRAGVITEDQFKTTSSIFPNGIIWQIFLFHIAKPSEYPIADQNVFCSMSVHKYNAIHLKQNWETYEQYRTYFMDIANACKILVDEQHLRELKRIDNALMSFGQFLKKYCKENLNKTPCLSVKRKNATAK